MMMWIQAHPLTLVGLVLWAIGILWLMPEKKASKPRPHMLGVLIVAVGLVTFCLSCGKAQSELADDVMFWVFAIGTHERRLDDYGSQPSLCRLVVRTGDIKHLRPVFTATCSVFGCGDNYRVRRSGDRHISLRYHAGATKRSGRI